METDDLPDFFEAFADLSDEDLNKACTNGWLYEDKHGNYRLTPKALEMAAWMTKR